jgi:hypothetical protein
MDIDNYLDSIAREVIEEIQEEEQVSLTPEAQDEIILLVRTAIGAPMEAEVEED